MGAHIQTVHEQKKPHVCPQCSKPFGLEKVLKRHIMSVHKGIKKFKCELCDFASIDKSHLKQHVGILHEKIKPEKCPHCPKLCTTKGNLSQHISSVHNAEKLHRCEICDVSFKEARSLKRHKMTSKGHLEIAASKLNSQNPVKLSNEHLQIENSEINSQNPVEEVTVQEIFIDSHETAQFVNGNSTETNVLYVLPEGYPITPNEFSIEYLFEGVNFDFE